MNAKLDKTNHAFANTWRYIHDIDSEELRANEETKPRRAYSRVVSELDELMRHRRRQKSRNEATPDTAPGQRIKPEAPALKRDRDAETPSTDPSVAHEPPLPPIPDYPTTTPTTPTTLLAQLSQLHRDIARLKRAIAHLECETGAGLVEVGELRREIERRVGTFEHGMEEVRTVLERRRRDLARRRGGDESVGGGGS